ncbi:hypothetical protein DPMN_113443 [Dreissena polymorpha]|uniref:Uncharacterized protein n=1 Tax=Dreissena polymorpha TaxID=45954 RepID=A0A9D4QRK0_DREPO|nr:hypothetical protein DPMN_113443 [Dreissena polymorpha]
MSSGQPTGGHGESKSDLENKGAQCNPNNPSFQGHQTGYPGTGTKSDLNNHSDQLNSNNERFQPAKK